MGVLVPDWFDVSGLANDAERRVVEACVRRLSDGWLVLPDVAIATRDREYQLDVVLVHEGYGVVDLEVKGHEIELRAGNWLSDGRPMEHQPPKQARTNSYALRELLRDRLPALRRLEVPYGVACPNTSSVEGTVEPEMQRVQLITGPMLSEMADAVEGLASMRANAQPLDADAVQQIIDVLRPDADFNWDPDARIWFARRRLDDICEAQVESLLSLDANRRAFVCGAAGTGKTRLAEGWARRAWLDDQRVLFTCYNEPLSDAVADRLSGCDGIVVGPFLRTALTFEGMPPLESPAGPHDEFHWWTVTVPEHLERNWSAVQERFDTIVVDEAQDFSPAWIEWLERLLDPDGPARLLLVADQAQDLYGRGFEQFQPDERWARCELASNCRNAQQIGRILRRSLGGAKAPSVAPEAPDVRSVEVVAGDLEQIEVAVRSEVERLVHREGRSPDSIAVLTFETAVRDHLAAAVSLVRWEDRGLGVLGENVHRVKGLEVDTVVLVSRRPSEERHLLYVGVSRAVSELIVVAPTEVAATIGLGR